MLISRHGKEIFGFCLYLTGSRTEAEDLYQDAFLKALERMHKMDGGQNPKAFLIAIAVGLWKNHRRKAAWRRRIAPMEHLEGDHTPLEGLCGTPTPEDIAVLREQAALVRNAAQCLTDRLKIPLYMHYTAGMPVEEIAAALRIPEGTVKSRLHHARKKMKAALEADPHEGRNLESSAEARLGAD